MNTGPVGMLRDEGGYVAKPQDALVLWPTHGQTNWIAADPPRVWDMLRHEDDELGWEQVKGLRALASLLTAQADKLAGYRDALAQMWPADQSTAASLALNRLDVLIASMRADSGTAIQNALAIDGIMTVTANAKREVHEIVKQWELTTHEGGPEWWDREAARLSYVTEQTMTATERAIRDHRAQITMPLLPSEAPKDLRKPIEEPGPEKERDPDPVPSPKTTVSSSRPARGPITIPSLPGYPPLVTTPVGNGPELQSATPPAPATPGQPVSMLPIAPGNPYAPYGGGYVLPGPGVGRNGYVVALPPPGSNSAAVVSSARGNAVASPGMMPMPMGVPGQVASRDGSQSGRRGADTRWEVTRGVPPVIGPEHSTSAAEPTQEEIETQFREWFTQTAMPWRTTEAREQMPIITIRRGATSS
ncbi:hypothetical protein [Catellatospora chokoriensis]|uniref:PPE family protein n=1 Tax=Catellatospora chokoriensis TaxID=310353 RepID=A0A8J3NRY6_9ACTN|nr:hypothetical protein [Catellatospora chokoriensis]GIF88625.1 hypothetical protein Cch02nite_20690 [Catellatospora chokoriensis]